MKILIPLFFLMLAGPDLMASTPTSKPMTKACATCMVDFLTCMQYAEKFPYQEDGYWMKEICMANLIGCDRENSCKPKAYKVTE